MTDDWLTFRHPLGLSLRHPPGWRIQHVHDALQIIPEDFDPNSELVVASGVAAPVAQVDPNLVGVWKRGRARHNNDGLGGGTFDSFSTTYSLAANGTYEARHRSFIDVSLPGGAGDSRTSESSSVGSWSADGKFLAVRDEEGGVVFGGSYKVFSNGIELLPTGGGEIVLLTRVG